MLCLGSTKPIRNPGGRRGVSIPFSSLRIPQNVVSISFPTLVHYFPAMKIKKRTDKAVSHTVHSPTKFIS